MEKILQFMPLPENMAVVTSWKEDGITFYRDSFSPDCIFTYVLALVEEDGERFIVAYESAGYAGFEPIDACPGCDAIIVNKKWLERHPPEMAFGMKPRKLGKWLNHEGNKATCSVCGEHQVVGIIEGNITTQFCAKCENPMDTLFDDMTKRWRDTHE